MSSNEQDGKKYNIVRHFRKSGRRKVLHRNVSLAVAKLHCNDPRTRREGVYFDAFEEAAS
jgi:hypothetical protein